EAKWHKVMHLGHLQRLRRILELLQARGVDTSRARPACYSGAGFAPELRDAEKRGEVVLVDLHRLYHRARTRVPEAPAYSSVPRPPLRCGLRRYRARPVPKSTAAHPAAKGAVPSWRGQAHQADRFPPLPPSDNTAKGRTVVSARASLGVENRR